MLHVFANDRLRLSVTNNCNFCCSYCTNEGQKHNGGSFVDLNFIEQLTDFILKNDIYIKKLNITGGEPLLHPKLIDIIKTLKKAAQNLTLNTNGELLDKKSIREFHEAGITCIKFGIDTFSRDWTKPFMRNCACHPSRIISNLLYAREIMPRSSVNIVLSKVNHHEFGDLLKFCINNKIDLVEILELIDFDFRRQNITTGQGLPFCDIFSSYKDFFKEISYNRRLGKYYCETVSQLTIQFAEDFCKSRVCRNLWTRIDSEGNLIPCIKSSDKIKIDFRKFISQITDNNRSMCNGVITNDIVRDTTGQRSTVKDRESYSPSYLEVIQNTTISFSDLDL